MKVPFFGGGHPVEMFSEIVIRNNPPGLVYSSNKAIIYSDSVKPYNK